MELANLKGSGRSKWMGLEEGQGMEKSNCLLFSNISNNKTINILAAL